MIDLARFGQIHFSNIDFNNHLFSALAKRLWMDTLSIFY